MSTTTSPPKWWTVSDLVEKTGLSRMTVIREIDRGNLAAHRQGSKRLYLVDPDEGARWVAETLRVSPVAPRKSDAP